MTKSNFIAWVATARGCSLAEAERSLEAVLAAFQKLFEEGESVTFHGFATLGVKERAARSGRNPQTGATLSLPARYVPYFKPSAALKARLPALRKK